MVAFKGLTPNVNVKEFILNCLYGELSNTIQESASGSPIRSTERVTQPIYANSRKESPRTDTNKSIELSKGLGLNSGKHTN